MLPIVIRPQPAPDHIKTLTQSRIHPLVAACLVRRGVVDPEIAHLKQKLLPYRELKGIKDTALGLAQAIIKQEKIVVVADYDCDGATACAIAVSGLEALGAEVDFVVPNRMIHGYGLTPSVVEIVAQKNPKHIVTVDNGIASIEGVRAANEKNIQVWVTDHHLPGDSLPEAAGIVNPNQPHCPFPSKNLAGCGVMFYVLWAIKDALKALGKPKDIDIGEWLDLVALGTVADVVKLDENNRWLVHQGLLRIRQGLMRPGIHALFEVSNRNWERATSSDFGFSLGPRINAAGRLDDMSIGIRCLLSKDDDEAMRLAQELCVLNEERKDVESKMKEEAWATVEIENQSTLFTRVVFGEEFHEGVIGIVAGRIKEKEYAPTLVFAKAENKDRPHEALWKGSGRSIPGLHLRDALDLIYKKHPDWFVKFGGHSMAAGLTIRDHARPHFAQAFEDVVREAFDHLRPQQQLVVDGKMPASDLSVGTARVLSDFVWGQGFEEPIWVNEFVVKEAKIIGRDQNHTRIKVSPLDGGGDFTALHFFSSDLPEEGSVITLAYKIQASEFNGEEKLDLLVVDR